MDELAIFTRALDIASPEERAAFLLQSCGANAHLLARVEALLQSHQAAGSFLQGNPLGGTSATVDQPRLELPGTQIGPYKLLQQIGEGGMGVVYMAEQTEPIARRVALKIIKPGMDTRQVIARFEAERQALAMMDHVNIARVLDAGATQSGRPYFVMELVHGVPITKYCDDNRLTPRQRLELFVPVCQAIQHAHQKGVIHRDIKPSNVMVTLYDGKPVPKVIDFGVAKATEQKLTERTLFTQFGTMVGTLEYMSPEQAEMSALGVDTRSDIYSLGVLLYELLTGSTPLSHKTMKEAAYAEILRLIKEEEPPKPSTRLTDSGEALASISAQRHTEPAKLSKLMRGELDWIVMKTLEKDRNRRYETANGFAADVQRYLNDEPVQACPPSAMYRFRKFARRNKRTVLVALTISLLLVGGIIGTTLGLLRAVEEAKAKEQARAAAEANFQRTRETVDEFFTLVSESALFDLPGLQPVRLELLEKAVRYYQEITEKRGNDPSVLVGLALAQLRLGHVYHAVNRNDDATKELLAGLDVVDRLRREYPTATEHHRKLGGYFRGYRPTMRVTNFPKDPDATQRMLTKHIDLWEKFIEEIPDEPGFQTDLAFTYSLLGSVEFSRQRHDEAFAGFHKAVALMEGRLRQSPKDPLARAILAQSYSQLAAHLGLANRPGREEPDDRALALLEELAVEFPKVAQHKADLANSLSSRGRMLASQERQQEAAAAFRRSVDLLNDLASQFPGVTSYSQTQAHNLRGLLPLLKEADQPKEVEKAFRPTIDVLSKLVAANPNEPSFRQQLAECLTELAAALTAAGQPIDAEIAARGAIAHWGWLVDNVPKQKQYRLRQCAAHHQLAVLHWRAQRPAETLAEFHKALEAAEKGAADFLDFAEAWQNIGERSREVAWQLRDLNRHSESEAAYARAVQAFNKARTLPGVSVPWILYLTADTHRNMAEVILHQQRPQEAEEQYRKAVEVFGTLPAVFLTDKDRRSVVNLGFSSLVGFLQSAKRPHDAVAVLRQSIDFHARLSAEMPGEPAFRQEMAARAAELGVAHYRAGDWKAAVETLRESMELGQGGEAKEWLFMAMAHWQLDQKDEARKWHNQAVEWMEKNKPENEELKRFRAEAAELLEIKTNES